MSEIKFNIAKWKERLKNGADINEPDETGRTALEQAVCADNIRGIKFCIKHGANINRIDELGLSPLEGACHGIYAKPILTLIKLGAKVNIKDKHGYSPLLNAAWCPYDVIKAFIDAGTDVNAKNEFGNTVLHEAASFNENPEVIRLLINAGADINAQNNEYESPLITACMNNKNPEIVKTLLDYGADVNIKNKYGQTCFEVAYSHKSTMLKPLLMNIKDINTRNQYAYHLAEKEPIPNLDTVRTLLECGIDISNFKQVFWACVSKSKIMQVLKQYGIKFNISPNTLFDASKYSKKAQPLLGALSLANINAKNSEGETALFLAVKSNSFKAVDTLLRAGADVNAQNNKGETPLSYAIKHKVKDKIFEKLLASGAKVNGEDKMRQSTVAAFLSRKNTKNTSFTQLKLFNNKDRENE